MAYWHYGDFRPSRPREVKGGIKAQSKRGGFGQSWWARRWIEALEGLDLGGRLSRGRSYARQGQVLSIEIGEGTVEAEVQGSRPRPYRVNIDVGTFTEEERSALAGVLATRAVFAAKLLAGEMPENIEEAFDEAGLSLFPDDDGDLETDCSCPDWSNPCKHIAAVYYLLGEEFDRDPFLIFKLRGIGREDLAELVGTQWESDTASAPPPPEPLPEAPEDFWGRMGAEYGSREEIYLPPAAAALPKRLGNFPFWRGQENFLEVMEDIYRRASPAGLNVFLGEYKATGEHQAEKEDS